MIRYRVRRHSRSHAIAQIAGLALLLALPPLAVVAHASVRLDECLEGEGCFDYSEWKCRFGDDDLCGSPMAFFPKRHLWLPIASGAAWIAGAGAILLVRRKGR